MTICLALLTALAACSDLVLLPTAATKYDSLFATIERAEHSIHLDYFWIANDTTGRRLFALLGDKARQGADVRVVIDGLANRKATHPWHAEELDSINRSGVGVRLFAPLRFPWVKQLAHRDHRKIAVVDGRTAFTGGMNIADYYITGTDRTGPWRDMHLMTTDTCIVSALDDLFERMWHGRKRTSETYGPVVSREPGKHSGDMRRAIVGFIDEAQRDLRIVDPYPTGVPCVRRALRRAARRGVRVQLMVSSPSDIPVTPLVIAMEMRRLARHGVEVYYYEDGFHHSKTITADGEHVSIGTANLDGRSLLFDYELAIFAHSPHTATQLDSIFASDLAHCTRLTRRNFRQRFNLGQRIAGRIASLIKRFF